MLLAELLPRWLALWLRIRRVTPGDRRPWHRVVVPPIDTGGGFRASWREQDPAKDPREPNGGESSSVGTDHGWSNCTMTSGALALAYQQPRGALAPWGGDLRHKQGDLSGGTDLYDLRTAWQAYGETLTIKSGAGWSAVVTAHNEGRAIVIQGSGNVPGSESFDGGHATVIAPETHSDGRWLWGDPLASGWQWVSASSIRTWAEHWQSSIAFAVGEKPPAEPPPVPPTPEPPPCPPVVPPGPELARAEELGAALALDEEVGSWIVWLRAGEPVDTWDVGLWGPIDPTLDELLAAGPCVEGAAACWARAPLLDPIAAARAAMTTAAVWDALAWRELVWR
jgi:hypothetical protein